MDEGERVELSGDAADRLLMLRYDFLKHLTSLSLLALGGAVTFAGSIFARVEDKVPLWAAVGLFALSALTAFQGQVQILRNLEPERTTRLAWYEKLVEVRRRSPAMHLRLATLFMGIGTGVLVAFAVDNLR